MTSAKVPRSRRLLSASAYNFPWPIDGGPWRVNLGFTADGHGLRCTSVSIVPADAVSPATITRTLLRDLPIDEITRAQARKWGESLKTAGYATAAQQVQMDTTDPRGRTEGFYREVAASYLEARDSGKPTSAVAAKWSVSITRAATWVRRARQRGLLPPTKQGRRQ